MTVIAAYNLKGGVGKTAAAVNLAWFAAQEGARVLLVDLDPQAAASFYLRVEPQLKGGSEKLIGKKASILDNINATEYPNLHVVPADLSHRNLDLILHEEKNSALRLRKILKQVGDDFDYIFLDCPPGLSLVSENVFNASDVLLVPVIPTHLSVRAYDVLTEFLQDNIENRPQLMPFFSMLDRRRQLHVQLVREFAGAHQEVLRVFIPYASQVERMGTHQAPLGVFASGSEPGRAFQALWGAVKDRLDIPNNVAHAEAQ
ncbi:MAG: AAA family ATPase [Gammaproteobacteria bacterium]